jgi:hypothetical protein
MALVPLHTNDNKDEYKAPHSIPTVHITICITYDIYIRIKLLNLSCDGQYQQTYTDTDNN